MAVKLAKYVQVVKRKMKAGRPNACDSVKRLRLMMIKLCVFRIGQKRGCAFIDWRVVTRGMQ